MNKILIEVYLPVTGEKYDIFIPVVSRVYEVIFLIEKVLQELSNGSFSANRESVLCDRVTGEIFNINMTIEELGLKNGSKVMII